MQKNNDTLVKDSKAGLIAQILVAIVFVSVGIAELLVSTDIISTVVYSFSVITMGILFICFGAYYMIKYIFNEEFVKVSNYGFTMGVILVIIGAVLIFRAADLSVFIDAIVCLVGLCLGAVMLQQALALFHIDRSSWIVALLFGFGTIGASIYLLMENQTFFNGLIIGCTYLIVVGSLSLICLIMMAVGLHDHKKFAEKMYRRNMEEAPSTAKKATDDSIFEDEPTVKEEAQQVKTEVTSDDVFEE